MRVLVTGGAGFIGANLVNRLIKEKHQVSVIDNLSSGKKENLNKKARFYKMDIQDPDVLKVFKKERPEVVFHYAAQIDVRKSVKDPILDAKINILGSLNIIENFLRINLQKFVPKFRKFIFASTGGAIYGEAKIIPTSENYPPSPLSPYGIDKLTIEKYLEYYHKVFKLPFVSLRLSNVYGPFQNFKGEAGVVAIFSSKMLKGEQPIIYGNGRQTRDFVFVEDVVEANILAMKSKKTGIYNIATGRETTINSLFDKIKKLTASTCKKVYGPCRLGEQRRSCLDFSKAKKELGWRPKYNLDKGLKKTIEWFKENL